VQHDLLQPKLTKACSLHSQFSNTYIQGTFIHAGMHFAVLITVARGMQDNVSGVDVQPLSIKVAQYQGSSKGNGKNPLKLSQSKASRRRRSLPASNLQSFLWSLSCHVRLASRNPLNLLHLYVGAEPQSSPTRSIIRRLRSKVWRLQGSAPVTTGYMPPSEAVAVAEQQ
jgi:hypothetical protein